MKAEFILINPNVDDVKGSETFVIDDIITIGREPNNDIFIDDDLISRNHALVRRVEGEYVLLDLGSSNGTFVNDKPVSAPTPLRHDDTIKLGKAVLVFRLHDESSEPVKRQRTTRRVFAAVNMAILVSDVRNFTELSEALPADGLSAILADWFRHVGTLVQTYQGNIEKIRGDSILAYWLAELDETSNTHIIGALNTAREMVAASRDFDGRMGAEYPGREFKIGCGVHTGEAVLGNIGTDARRDYTTLGDCVNITFRIESLCSTLQRSILVSDEITKLAGAGFDFEDLGAHKLKGKPKPIHIFAMPE